MVELLRQCEVESDLRARLELGWGRAGGLTDPNIFLAARGGRSIGGSFAIVSCPLMGATEVPQKSCLAAPLQYEYSGSVQVL